MHLADAFIQSDLHCIQVTVSKFLSALAFPGNRTHDLGFASTMLYYLSYRKAYIILYKFLCYSGSCSTFYLSPWGNSVSLGFNLRFTNNRKTQNSSYQQKHKILYYIILTPMYDLSNRLYSHSS